MPRRLFCAVVHAEIVYFVPPRPLLYFPTGHVGVYGQVGFGRHQGRAMPIDDNTSFGGGNEGLCLARLLLV